MNLQITEDYVDATRGCRLGESGWYEPYTDNRGELYRALVKEHGRCTGKVYVDKRTPAPDDGTTGAYVETPEPVGWVFVKRQQYEDTRKPYLAETWVTIREGSA